jgi:hypothetical protein
VYNVKGPGHLWHADGCHKLRRWGFVVHAAIDGFSRTVAFIRCMITTVLDGRHEGMVVLHDFVLTEVNSLANIKMKIVFNKAKYYSVVVHKVK